MYLGWPQTCYAEEYDLELLILLSFPECWDYGLGPLCLAYLCWRWNPGLLVCCISTLPSKPHSLLSPKPQGKKDQKDIHLLVNRASLWMMGVSLCLALLFC